MIHILYYFSGNDTEKSDTSDSESQSDSESSKSSEPEDDSDLYELQGQDSYSRVEHELGVDVQVERDATDGQLQGEIGVRRDNNEADGGSVSVSEAIEMRDSVSPSQKHIFVRVLTKFSREVNWKHWTRKWGTRRKSIKRQALD